MIREAAGCDLQQITVCLVGNHDSLGADLEHFLARSPEVRYLGAYADAASALPHILRRKPHVVILDFGLPVMKGGEFVRHLKEKLPAVGVLILTDSTDDEVFISLHAGTDGILDRRSLKASHVELVCGICDVHAGHHPLSHAARRMLLRHFHRSTTTKTFVALLCRREQEIIPFLEQGLSDKEIAGKLFISEATVHTHLHRIYAKLHVPNRTAAVLKLRGLIE